MKRGVLLFKLMPLVVLVTFSFQDMQAAPAMNSERTNYLALAGQAQFDSFIVYYAKGAQEDQSSQAIRDHLEMVGQRTGHQLDWARTLATGGHLVRVNQTLNEQSARALMEAFLRNDNVVYVEPDITITIDLAPNDTLYYQQWHYHSQTSEPASLDLEVAWDTATGAGQRVAVLDTGITNHTDLNTNIVGGYDFISYQLVDGEDRGRDGDGRDPNAQDEGDWYDDGECGQLSARQSTWHGTHVSGTVAAITNNNSGVSGVGFGSKVVPVRVLGKCGGTLSDIAEAIIWASGGAVVGVPTNSYPARVLNLSLSASGSCGSTFQNAIDTAVSNGATVVVSAGNRNDDAAYRQPSSCNNTVTVAAVDRQGNRAYYSNYGSLIDLSAPGGETNVNIDDGVLSTWNTGVTVPSGETYARRQGTSMAVPHVAGLSALMLDANPALTPGQVETLLENTARPLPGNCSDGCGAGIADAGAAVNAALTFSPQCGTDGFETKVFYEVGPYAQYVNDMQIEVPSDYVVVGGGVKGNFNPGNFIVSSYPNFDLTAWVISTKDHIYASSYPVTGYAIGMKVTGLSASELRSHLTRYYLGSDYDRFTEITASIPQLAIGGGADINWTGWGGLLYKNYPLGSSSEIIDQWNVNGREHGNPTYHFLYGFGIGVDSTIPGIGEFKVKVTSSTSTVSNYPQTTATVAQGYRLVGCGFRSNWMYPDDLPAPGHVVWKAYPQSSSGVPTACNVGAKDLKYTDYRSVTAFAIGLQLCK